MKLQAKISPCYASKTRSKKSQGFSLIEVLLAMAVVSFGLLSVVGLAAGGIVSSKNSSTDQALASISRSLRADLQATPFSTWSSGTSTNYYFTYDGYPTTQSSSGQNAPYYTVALTPQAPSYPANGTSQNAYAVVANVSYPYPVNAQVSTNSYFIAE